MCGFVFLKKQPFQCSVRRLATWAPLKRTTLTHVLICLQVCLPRLITQFSLLAVGLFLHFLSPFQRQTIPTCSDWPPSYFSPQSIRVQLSLLLPWEPWELNNQPTSVWSPEKGRGPDVGGIGLMGVGFLAPLLGSPVSELGLELRHILEPSVARLYPQTYVHLRKSLPSLTFSLL